MREIRWALPLILAVSGAQCVSAGIPGASQRTLDSLPYRFEENRGQAPAGNPFVARSANYEVLIGAEGPVIEYNACGGKRATLGTIVRGGNRHAVISGEQAESTRSNYIFGNEPAKWLENVSSYGR